MLQVAHCAGDCLSGGGQTAGQSAGAATDSQSLVYSRRTLAVSEAPFVFGPLLTKVYSNLIKYRRYCVKQHRTVVCVVVYSLIIAGK